LYPAADAANDASLPFACYFGILRRGGALPEAIREAGKSRNHRGRAIGGRPDDRFEYRSSLPATINNLKSSLARVPLRACADDASSGKWLLKDDAILLSFLPSARAPKSGTRDIIDPSREKLENRVPPAPPLSSPPPVLFRLERAPGALRSRPGFAFSSSVRVISQLLPCARARAPCN